MFVGEIFANLRETFENEREYRFGKFNIFDFSRIYKIYSKHFRLKVKRLVQDCSNKGKY